MMRDDPRDTAGALTGASGEASPADPEDEFVPAERRAIEDDATQTPVTASLHREAEARRTREEAPGTADVMTPNQRDGGYGSVHGLDPDDPAYAMERASGTPAATPAPPMDDSAGSDEAADPRDDRY